jgi:hypothetical protein
MPEARPGGEEALRIQGPGTGDRGPGTGMGQGQDCTE